MNHHHLEFINEYLATGDKLLAYRKAYPKAKETSLVNAANRLMQREDVSAIIRKSEERALQKAEAALKKRVTEELLSLHETQLLLTRIVRGQHTTEKQVKERGAWTPIDVKPTHNIMLRAINTYFRLSAAKAPSISPQRRVQDEPGIFPPPCREPEGASTSPHPFGNIYPATYPGPYYDPNDPNTKEKLQNLSFAPSVEKAVPAGAEAPASSASTVQPSTQAITQPAGQTYMAPSCQTEAVAGYAGNVQSAISTTKNNKTTEAARVLNNSRFSPRVQQMLLRDALRKDGWLTVEDATNEVYETYLRSQDSHSYKALKRFEKIRAARNLPAEERAVIEKETGWVYHPEHSFMIKRHTQK